MDVSVVYASDWVGCPRVVRADRGSENVNIAALQRMFRHDCGDEFAGEKAFMYGRSTANQVRAAVFFLPVFVCDIFVIHKRIEAWWGHLKKNGAKWWTDFFKVSCGVTQCLTLG